jgi:hypothetical protein
MFNNDGWEAWVDNYRTTIIHFCRTSIVDENLLYPFWCLMIPQYEIIMVFHRSSILVYIARLSARLWDIVIYKVSINHMLTRIHYLLKRHHLLFPWMLTRSIVPFGGSNPPPLHYRRSLNGFLRHLHSFRCIYRRVPRLSDNIVINECVWKIICSILQNYYFLNLESSFFYTWIRGYDGLLIPIYFLTFWMVIVISP